jgi:hypothetical protein
MQEWFNMHKSINVNRIKKKLHDHLNRCIKSLCHKIQHPFMEERMKKLGIEGTYLNIIKAKYANL